MRCTAVIMTYAKTGADILIKKERSIPMMFHNETEEFINWEAPKMMAQFDKLDKLNSDPFEIIFFRTYHNCANI